jgi:ketosteroid isomerase-like protein
MNPWQARQIEESPMGRSLKLSLVAVALLVTGMLGACTPAGPSYADDRAAIDDLLSRYLFALDWQDPEMYGDVFTEDGVLVWAGGTVNGRAAIVQEMRNAKAADERSNAATPDLRPFKRRHFVSNFVVRIDGDTATARSLWFEFNNDGADRKPYVGAYGHLEDELRRVDGQWLIAHHKVFNEQRENMAAGSENPAW